MPVRKIKSVCETCKQEFGARIYYNRPITHARFCSTRCKTAPTTRIDLTGRKFGRLTVLSYSHSDFYKRCTDPIWNVICECGKEKLVGSKGLLSGGTSSCGCLAKELHILPFGESSFNAHYASYKNSAKQRELVFELDIEFFKKIVSEDCVYCGEAPKRKSLSKKLHGYVLLNGIDRIDSSIGYIEKNCAPCCTDCNKMKMVMTREKFLFQAAKITEFQKQKETEFPVSYLTVIA